MNSLVALFAVVGFLFVTVGVGLILVSQVQHFIAYRKFRAFYYPRKGGKHE